MKGEHSAHACPSVRRPLTSEQVPIFIHGGEGSQYGLLDYDTV
jgi:hypothetical protein